MSSVDSCETCPPVMKRILPSATVHFTLLRTLLDISAPLFAVIHALKLSITYVCPRVSMPLPLYNPLRVKFLLNYRVNMERMTCSTGSVTKKLGLKTILPLNVNITRWRNRVGNNTILQMWVVEYMYDIYDAGFRQSVVGWQAVIEFHQFLGAVTWSV